ncbi:MAG: SusD/RagB family nutrient-binding outer membrane lipoprotein [Rubricoccaceae bacterium]
MLPFARSLTAGALVLALAVAGCDGFLDINEDPNNPTDVPPRALLANASFATGANTQRIGATTSFYVQYLASPNAATAVDIYERVSLDATWGGLYSTLNDLRALETRAEARSATAYTGIARILTAYHLAAAVDLWGAVPYSTALSPDQNLNPTYDDPQQLYAEVIRLLDGGIAALQAGNSTISPAGDDFIYGGNLGRWIRAAYSLKARYLNHLAATPGYDASAVLAAVDNGFTGPADNMQVRYFAEQRNPWATVAINNANLLLGGWLSETIVNALNGTTYGVPDPRIEAYTDALADGTYVGTRNGAGRGTAPERGARSVLTVNTYYAAPTAPVELITYHELKFIEAEAALRSGQATRAYAAYLAGIRAHMTTLGVETAAAEAYVAAPQVGVGAGSLTLADVFREKYKVMFLHPEAWVDARRFNYAYAGFQMPVNAALPEFIRRVDYPDTEYTRNRANVPASTLTTRLFWDR